YLCQRFQHEPERRKHGGQRPDQRHLQEQRQHRRPAADVHAQVASGGGIRAGQARGVGSLACAAKTAGSGRAGRRIAWHSGAVMRNWFVPIAAALLSGAVSAADIGGVRVEDKASLGGQELVLNGAGVRRKVVFNVYVASLYLPQKAAD